MSLDEVIRPRSKGLLLRGAVALVKVGIKPNTLTVFSLLTALLAGIAFYLSGSTQYCLLTALLLVMVSGIADAFDGAIARYLEKDGRRGDFLDHVVDRYADLFFLCGIFFGGYAPVWVGVLAITGVLLTSYMGTQAQAVTSIRLYGGIMGRFDRLIILILATALNIIYPANLFSMPVLGWALLFIGITGHITALQRFHYVWKEIK
ncbi:MAG: CDP-alcohol phosphatidyltransferase family protein [Methermicoccaceae archaeon]